MESIISGRVSRTTHSLCSRSAIWILLLALAAPVFGQLTVTGYNGVSATISSSGAWTVSVAHPAWKFSGSTGAPVYASRIDSGTDDLGAFQELAFDYTISSKSRSGSIRVYPGRPVVL